MINNNAILYIDLRPPSNLMTDGKKLHSQQHNVVTFCYIMMTKAIEINGLNTIYTAIS